MKREEQRVLAGSLNVLAPSDKTPENDAIDLLNFRVDQAGVLRGADTFVEQATFPGWPLLSHLHTLVPLSTFGNVAYGSGVNYADLTFAAGSFLVGAGTTLYLYSPAFGIDILATGFSGNPLSIVPWNGFFWVMDSLQRIALYPPALVSNGAGAVQSWLPAAPATACTAADLLSYTGGLVDNGYGYQYFVTFSNDYVDANGVTHREESTSSPVSAEVRPVNGFLTLGNLPIPGRSANGFGLVRNIYRQGGALTGPYSLPQPASDGTALLDSTSDASLMASGTLWNAPAAGGTNAPSAPTVAPTLTGGLVAPAASSFNGNSYVYYVTFVASTGLETNPGPASASVTPSEGQIRVTALPTTTDPSVIAWRLYRSGGTLGQAFQVAQINMNAAAGSPALQAAITYTDGASDLALTELDIAMPGSDPVIGANDPPPAAAGMEGPYFNYLLAFDGNRLSWSQNGVPLFPGSALTSTVGNWVNVGSGDDEIQAITFHTRVAIIYKQRSIWRLIGDPVEGYLEQTSSAVGALARRAVANCGAFDILLSTDGLFLFDQDAEHKLSEKLDPIFYGVTNWEGLGASDLRGYTWMPGALAPPVCAYLNGTVLVSDGNGTAFLYHVETGRFAAFKSNMGGGYGITAVSTNASAQNYWIGDTHGNLGYAVPQAVPGQSYLWQTRFLDQGLGDQLKVYDEIVLDLELNGATATVYLFYDNTSAAPASVNAPRYAFTGTARQKFYIPLQEAGVTPQAYPHIGIRIFLSGASLVPPAIHGLYLYWAPEPRDAASRNTQIVDFHSDYVSLARKVAVNAFGEIALTISTDEPNGLAARYTKTVGTPGARQWLKFNLPPNVRGRLWRVQSVATGGPATARLHSVRAWMRKTGTAGEEAWAWESWLEGDPPAEIPDAA